MSAAGRTQHSPSRSQAPPPKQQFTVVKTPPPPPPRTWEKNQPRDEINTPKTVFGASSVYPMRHMKSRGLILSSMQRIYSYVERFNPETTSTSELEIRLETLQSIYSKFNAVQDSIIAQAETEEEMQDVEEKAEQFESMLFTTKARIVDLLRRSEDSQSVPDAPSAVADLNVFKLPPIQLPVFDGDVMQWLPFSDSFTAMIHDNRGLSEIQKFHYLKSSLRGPALEIVNTLETTSGNYNIAWDLLRNRYQNKRVLMEKYVRGLFNLPTLSKESGKDLRKLHTDLNKHVAVINQLGIPTQAWDKIIVILISQKLDPFTYKEWENDTNPTELPSLNNFNSFLERRCQTLEAREVNRLSQLSISTGMKPAIRATPRPMLAHPSTQVPCLLECPTPHPLFMCPKFTEKHPSERIDTLRILGLCFNCMRSNHMANVCQARCCQKCGAKHNTMLHIERQDDTVALNSCGLPSVPATQILLATAVVLVADRQGDYIPCRAMLDSGSQTSFISSNLVRTLRLQSNGKRLAIRGIGGTSCTATQSVQGTIKSRFNDFTVQLEFVVIDEITGIIPARKYNPSDLDLPTGIAVADPSFYKPARIDVLLGAEVFHEILVGEPIVRHNLPALQNTQFGFVVSGKMNNSPPQRSGPLCHLQTQREIYDDANVEMLWNLEEHGSVASRNDEELECESHFVKNTVRNSDGRFMVQLPLKENPAVLGDSKCYAMSMFSKLEARLSRDQLLRSMYISFMREYQTLGHMMEIPEHCLPATSYFIPHHAVLKMSSSSTKLRVVFNASAKTTTGKSLNDILLIGPNVQNDIQSILIRFTMHRYVFVADIKKMYRQILVDHNSANLQIVLWRESPMDELKCYRLQTVTYGTASASFLATRCLKELADVQGVQFPLAREIIIHDTYVDDVVTGANSEECLIRKKDEIVQTLDAAKFELHKWSSNSNELLSGIDEADREPPNERRAVKTLGIYWDPESDSILYNICNDKFIDESVTKRLMLQCIASVYDPLGFISPILTSAKRFLQRVWADGYDWDEIVSSDIAAPWIAFVSELSSVNALQIPRHIILNSPCNIQLHGFCDASGIAYGAVLYVRSEDLHGGVRVQILYARSRIAPTGKKGTNLKKRTSVELELCGAALLAEMTVKVVQALEIVFDSVSLWTDSAINLARICSDDNRWNVFVANRVSKIQNTTSVASWKHISGTENPADILSRGCQPNQLQSNQLWWNGPTWLTEPLDQWPRQYQITASIVSTNERVCALTALDEPSELFGRFSSLSRLVSVVGWCLRFVNAARKRLVSKQSSLSADELDGALTTLVKLCQTETFGTELRLLRSGKPVPSGSRLSTLNPTLNDGLIVVGGRLNNASLSQFQKHPIILPQHHPLTRMIVMNEHMKGHLPEKALLYAVRRKYWPLCGQRVVHNTVRSCLPCFKAKPRGIQQLMGSMPSVRVTPARAFLNTGIDFCGPIKLKNPLQRKHNITKAWICVFVCMSVKAVHLEIVTSLSTDGFLMALDRFLSRRGNCQNIYCDNGTNFIGAKNEMEQLYNNLADNADSIKRRLNEHRVQWHFIPPRAPNFGGIWEACVKQVKLYIQRSMGDTAYTYEGYSTLLCKIEACLNSRPLTPISNDPNDLLPLTPAHFIIGESMIAPAEPDYSNIPTNRLSMYQDIKQRQQVFWKRFSKEYLNTLQQRMKNRRLTPNLAKGQLVIIKEDNLPPLKWAMGRIVDLTPGNDGLVRVAEVRTTGGVIKRSISKICPLPTEQQLDNLEDE